MEGEAGTRFPSLHRHRNGKSRGHQAQVTPRRGNGRSVGIGHVLPKRAEWLEPRTLGPGTPWTSKWKKPSVPSTGTGMVGAVGSGPFLPHGWENGRSDPVSRNQKPPQPSSSSSVASSRKRQVTCPCLPLGVGARRMMGGRTLSRLG